MPQSNFEHTLAQHTQELLWGAVRMCRCWSDAEDLTQETIARAWEHRHHVAPDTNLRAWLYRIMRNAFIDGYRRRQREDKGLAALLVEVNLNEEAAYGHDHDHQRLHQEVQGALEGLNSDARELVTQVDMHGLSYAEAALLLGCPLGTVMSRLHRARKKLERQLRAYAQTEGYIQADEGYSNAA